MNERTKKTVGMLVRRIRAGRDKLFKAERELLDTYSTEICEAVEAELAGENVDGEDV